MGESAALLVDEVLPEQPMPKALAALVGQALHLLAVQTTASAKRYLMYVPEDYRIPDRPGKRPFVLFRACGPTKAWFEGTWPNGFELLNRY